MKRNAIPFLFSMVIPLNLYWRGPFNWCIYNIMF